MPDIDFTTAMPIETDERGVDRIKPEIDFASAKPVNFFQERVFNFLDSDKALADISKALYRGTENALASVGKFIGYYGKTIKAEAESQTTPVNITPFPIYSLRATKPDSPLQRSLDSFYRNIGDKLDSVGGSIKRFFEGAANKGIETPNPAIMSGWSHPFRKSIILASENVPMLMAAAGVTAATKNPIMGAAIFAPVAYGDMYEDAISNNVDPQKAEELAMLSAAGQTVLETIPLGNWLKGGFILKRIAKTAISEGLIEEGSQQLFDNSLRILGWKESRTVFDRLTDGLAESIVAGTLSGGLLGSFTPPTIEDIRYDLHNRIIDEGLKNNLNEEQISRTIDVADTVLSKFVNDVGIVDNSGKEIKINSPEIQEGGDYAEKIRAEIEKGSEQAQGMVKGEEERLRLRDAEKYRVEAKSGEVEYSLLPENAPKESKEFVFTGSKKEIPPITSTGKMEWEKTDPWRVNLGRDIEGVFEREIGPKLKVSNRFKRFLGAYYPKIGQNGTIKIRSLGDEMTLFHEAGHFLDDSLSGLTGFGVERSGKIKQELLKVTHSVTPFEEKRVPVIDPETGEQKISKRTGKPLTKFDSYTSYRRSSKELFAQYVSLYVNDPVTAKLMAPEFTNVIEKEIAKDKEFAYIVNKLRDFSELLRPQKEFLMSLRLRPKIDPAFKEWTDDGNFLQNIWREQFSNKIYDTIKKQIDVTLGKNKYTRSFFVKGGINDLAYEVLRQRKKLVDGQIYRAKERIIDNIAKVDEDGQKIISESLQRFEELPDENPLKALTEESRKELALWGNELRKLGLLNESTFWNTVGTYFPFLYSSKEFSDNKKNLSFISSKKIRSSLGALKHKMTDEEFGRKVLESKLGTWPSSKEKIGRYSREELEDIGIAAREELGLIKTAAYPLQKRFTNMISLVYAVEGFNAIAEIPGIVGNKDSEGYIQMPKSKRYGNLSEKYIPESLYKEINKVNEQLSDWKKLWLSINSAWKQSKVVLSPSAWSRNIITNAITAYMGDVPIYNPSVFWKGVSSFVSKDKIYEELRDRGLYHHTYSSEELDALAFKEKEYKSDTHRAILEWATQIAEKAQTPARLYGAVEDASKTIVARYVIDNGGTPEQAVKFADKLIFDYSQVSEAVGVAKQFAFPFITWSSKIAPLLFEYGIRKPEKFIMIALITGVLNGLSRGVLGLKREEEERMKPDWIRGKPTVLMPSRNKNGSLEWVDLTYFLPWGGWLPINKGRLAVPQTFVAGNPLITAYNAYVLNNDPFFGEIAPTYLSEDEQLQKKNEYVMRSLLPAILMQSPAKIYESLTPDKYGRDRELSKILLDETLGIKFVQDNAPYQKNIVKKIKSDYSRSKNAIVRELKENKISQDKAQEKLINAANKYSEEIGSMGAPPIIRKKKDYTKNINIRGRNIKVKIDANKALEETKKRLRNLKGLKIK